MLWSRKKKYALPCQVVTARTGHHVDRPAGRDGSRHIEVHFRKLELLHGLLGKVHRRHAAAGGHVIGNVAAVDGDHGAVARAEHADREQSIELARRARGDSDAGLELRQLQIAAAVQRQVLDGAARR